MSKLIPRKDYVILELPDNHKKRIVLPDNRDPLKVGTSELVVMLCGPSCKDVKPGDRLVVDPAAMPTFAFENRQYWITREEVVGAMIR